MNNLHKRKNIREEMSEQSQIKQENCYTIYDFMIDQLGLTGSALLVYAVIYSHCLQYGSYTQGIVYLSKMTGSSERSVQLNLKKLENDELIFKSDQRDDLRRYKYFANAIKF